MDTDTDTDTSTDATAPAEARGAARPPVTEAEARAHVIAPDHVRDVVIETVDPAQEVSLEITRAKPATRGGGGVDLGEFGLTVHNALKNVVTGYMLHIRQNGTLVHVGAWNWAQTPADQGKGWTEDTRMHVASVSKFLTAVGMVRLLKARNISVDAKIVGYLPTYWAKGKNIDKITFRHLLTHTSGFGTGGSATDFTTMKSKVAAGVAGVGASDYENMNFGLCRILISVINGDISKGATFAFMNDAIWDTTTISAYRKYMQANIFTPAGVANASFAPLPGVKAALAYPFPAFQQGWNSGDLGTVSGGAGWRLSVKDLLNVLDHVRRRNTILSAAATQTMLDSGFGIDQITDTPAGKLYNKNGSWGNGGRTEQSVAFFWPGGMELALFVNSPIGAAPGASLRNLVRDSFLSSL